MRILLRSQNFVKVETLLQTYMHLFLNYIKYFTVVTSYMHFKTHKNRKLYRLI